MRPVQVWVVEPNEIYRHGLVLSLTGDSGVQVTFAGGHPPGNGKADVTIASADSIGVLDGYPCVLYSDDPSWRPPRGSNVHAVLPRRTMTPEQLIATVRAAAAGLRVTVEAGEARAVDDRRIRVLRLLAEGADTREIAQTLSYSERTVKTMIGDVKHSLGARSRAQTVAEGIRRGLI